MRVFRGEKVASALERSHRSYIRQLNHQGSKAIESHPHELEDNPLGVYEQ